MITRSMSQMSQIDRNKLYCATGLVNYIRTDCIIDYLDHVKKNNYQIDFTDNFKIKKRGCSLIFDNLDNTSLNNTNFPSSNKKRKTSFDYIMEDGYKFENNIFMKIKSKLEENNQLNLLIEIDENDITKRYNITKDVIINRKYDIILGGLLINMNNNTYGYPDIIVSGYWIRKYIKDYPNEIPNDKSIYYVIDVKSSSINLISGGENISSGLLYDGYKAQIFIYKEALNDIIGIKNDIAFVLGKKYEYCLSGKKIKIDDPFSHLAIINYSFEKHNGKDFSEQIKKAVEWKKDLDNNWKNYSLYPIEKSELYPNMKNAYDKNYRQIKKQIAIKNKEITLLWNCGVKNRTNAFKKGINRYDDKKISPEILGFEHTSKKYKIIDLMLKMNKTENKKLIRLDKKNNHMDWRNKIDYEFFVDFETYSKEEIYGENTNEYFIENLNNQGIYMIGVNYLELNTQKEKFKCFIIKFDKCEEIEHHLTKLTKLNVNKCIYEDYVFCLNETDLIEKFVNFINSFNIKKIKQEQFYKKVRLIHWSFAEPIIFNKKLLEYNIIDDKFFVPWYDLLTIFKYEESPIIIKECFSFGLKEIVKKLDEYKMINLKWPELDDGLLSSFIAKNIYKNKISVDEKIKNMIDIVEYNYVDCIAINKLLEFMRNYKK